MIFSFGRMKCSVLMPCQLMVYNSFQQAHLLSTSLPFVSMNTCILYSLLIFSVSPEKSFADVRLALFIQRRPLFLPEKRPAEVFTTSSHQEFGSFPQIRIYPCPVHCHSDWKASIFEQKRNLLVLNCEIRQ